MRSVSKIKILFCFLFVSIFFTQNTLATNKFHYPFYAGVAAGYGSTTWDGLVPSRHKQNDAIKLFTPIRVHEGGPVWGFFAGYEIIPCFAVEMNYMRFPKAKIIFDPKKSYFKFITKQTYFITHTEMAAFMGKVMMFIPKTIVRVFSSAGFAIVHRDDFVTNRHRVNPTFSFGVNYNFTEHIMGEAAVNYTGGYGESELDPVKDYIPFLYSGSLRLAYRF